MGFRISTEVGRMNVRHGWAEIAVAALQARASMAVALVERAVLSGIRPFAVSGHNQGELTMTRMIASLLLQARPR